MTGPYFICGEYDPSSGVVGKLYFVVSQEEEGNWASGQDLEVNGKTYVLGSRSLDRKSTIVTYELVVRLAPTAGTPLPLED